MPRAIACGRLASVLAAGCHREREEPRPDPHIEVSIHSGDDGTTAPLVEVTPAAAEVRRHLEDLKVPGCYLRVHVVPGGCRGFTNKLDLAR